MRYVITLLFTIYKLYYKTAIENISLLASEIWLEFNNIQDIFRGIYICFSLSLIKTFLSWNSSPWLINIYLIYKHIFPLVIVKHDFQDWYHGKKFFRLHGISKFKSATDEFLNRIKTEIAKSHKPI